MRILLVTPYYYPDLGPSSPMLSMLSEDMAAAGHAVTVISAVPHFPNGIVAREYRRGLWQSNIENGVRVLRLRVPSGKRSNLIHRLLVFFVFQVLAGLSGLRMQYDLLLITNPALETWFAYVMLGWIRRKPIILAVWDIYPDVGIQLGLFRSRLVIWLINHLERFCLLHSSAIQTLSDGLGKTLQERIPPTIPVRIIRPWLDVDALQPAERHNSFSKEHLLDDSFVIMYSGNIGYSQGLEHILSAAHILREHVSIKFVFVGDGVQREELVTKVQALNLENVCFIPFQPHERLTELFATADVALVSQRAQIGMSSLPSKTFSWMAAGRPILAFAEHQGELAQLLLREHAGLQVEPFEVNVFVRSLLELESRSELRKQMGRNGRSYIMQNHSRVTACDSFINLFNEVLRPSL